MGERAEKVEQFLRNQRGVRNASLQALANTFTKGAKDKDLRRTAIGVRGAFGHDGDKRILNLRNPTEQYVRCVPHALSKNDAQSEVISKQAQLLEVLKRSEALVRGVPRLGH